MTKVSVILPIYNETAYLPKCLDSVLSQTLQDIEIILATDGPEDCDKICADYAKNDNRIKIIFHPGSYGKAINQGIELAQGKYIGIVEADDWCDPVMFEKLYQTAEKYDNDVTKAGFYCVQKHKKNKKNFSLKMKFLTPDQDGDFFSFQPSLWSAIYKTSFLREKHITFIEDRLSFIDTPFVLETFIKADRFMYLPDILYFYNCNNPSASVKNLEKIEDPIIAERFFYNKINSKIFLHIKKAYLAGLASRLKWNLDRIKTDENKARFWKISHEYIKQLCISELDLSSFLDEGLKQLMIFLSKTDQYEIYKKAVYNKRDIKLFGFSVFRAETIAWKQINLYLFNVIPLCCIKIKNGKYLYKLFNILPIYKKKGK